MTQLTDVKEGDLVRVREDFSSYTPDREFTRLRVGEIGLIIKRLYYPSDGSPAGHLIHFGHRLIHARGWGAVRGLEKISNDD